MVSTTVQLACACSRCIAISVRSHKIAAGSLSSDLAAPQICMWVEYTDSWCYARNTRWAYQQDLMVYKNLDTGADPQRAAKMKQVL